MESFSLVPGTPVQQLIFPRGKADPLTLDIFETPVTMTPQQEISKNFKFFKNSLKILNVYSFGGKNVYSFGGTSV